MTIYLLTWEGWLMTHNCVVTVVIVGQRLAVHVLRAVNLVALHDVSSLTTGNAP